MLKIAVITRHFPSSGEPWQGRSSYQTLSVLARKAKVHVFYPNAAYPSFLTPRSRLYRSLDSSYCPVGVEASYHDYPAVPLLSRSFNGSVAARTLLPYVRGFRPDIIFGIFLYPAGYTALKIARKLSVPVVVKAVGSDLHSIGDRISAAHTRTVLEQADFVVTASEDLRRRAIALGAPDDRCTSNINGCNVAIFRPGDRLEARRRLNLDHDAHSVVYIGRMDERKGLLELVDAAKRLHAKRPNLRFYMVGEGPDRNKIVRAIEAAHGTGYAKVFPACSPEEVALWMTAADVVTLPSYMEGCPNVVLEALACGRPVVATEVGGIPEIMNDTCGRLIPPRNADALADALDFVLDREWDAAAISARWGRGWDTVAAELLSIFESLTRG